ncbi:hypothetical protein F441_02717 [Phytophthora nicotianae CJ01A1]|uniref:Uncharacterized protein n=2 Tax=Phytophthora nicotianae TaxID=4792 RepID=V9FSF2_PHYNI|nr:hypothetical protein F443_02750 [Phytophthora nicotianae P1569]ETP24259.1 hypothetical protein F441_02717 [Phytophthora nicotianae CJ01A1]
METHLLGTCNDKRPPAAASALSWTMMEATGLGDRGSPNVSTDEWCRIAPCATLRGISWTDDG